MQIINNSSGDDGRGDDDSTNCGGMVGFFAFAERLKYPYLMFYCCWSYLRDEILNGCVDTADWLRWLDLLNKPSM